MEEDSSATMEMDLLVLGGGMAGMTAAAYATSKGLSVGVVEKAAEIGGTSVLSAGGLGAPLEARFLQALNPGGDPVFAELLATRYSDLCDWINSLDVRITEPTSLDTVLGFPSVVRGLDVLGYIAVCKVTVENAGGWVITQAYVESIEQDGDRVVRAMVRDRDGVVQVRTPAIVLATGGFSASAEMRARHLGHGAENMLLRGNPCSVGDGLRLAQSVGGAATEVMNRFYGHLIPTPLNHEFKTSDYVRLSMPFLSPRSIILGKGGDRILDESSGYYNCAQAVLRQPGSRALLIGDQTLREADTAGASAFKTLGIEFVDRPTEAARLGANVREASTLGDLDAGVAAWGYRGVAKAVDDFNRGIEMGLDLAPPRLAHRRVLTAPFFAFEVQPSVTTTFGGIRIDGKARVLRSEGTPVEGLFAAGADAGGYFCERYCSGLAMGSVIAMRAVETIVEQKWE